MKPPAGLTTAGRALWAELAETYAPLTRSDRPLIDNVCRISDRLDALDRVIRGVGPEWVILKTGAGGDLVIVVNGALAESRAQALALRALLSELRQSRPAAKPAASTPQSTGAEAPSAVTSITARIAAKRGSGSP